MLDLKSSRKCRDKGESIRAARTGGGGLRAHLADSSDGGPCLVRARAFRFVTPRWGEQKPVDGDCCPCASFPHPFTWVPEGQCLVTLPLCILLGCRHTPEQGPSGHSWSAWEGNTWAQAAVPAPEMRRLLPLSLRAVVGALAALAPRGHDLLAWLRTQLPVKPPKPAKCVS